MLDGSGSGKSASYVIPNAYQLLGSYVFTDPKGELYAKTAGFMKAHGYKIKVLKKADEKNKKGNINIVLVILLVFSAFFSSCETSLSSANIIRLKGYVEEKRKGAKKRTGSHLSF